MQTEEATYVCKMDKKLQEKAKKELNEKPDRRNKDIQALRDMVNAHPGIKCPTDDNFLLRFLRARKFNLDRAYDLLLNYYVIRAENPDAFKDFLPSKCEHIMAEKLMMILPNRDKEGRRIVYFRPGKWNPDKVTDKEILKFTVMDLELCVQEEESQVNGVILVGDFKDLSLRQVTAMERGNHKLMPAVLQDGFPIRVKAFHICRQPAIFSTAWAIISPFMKEKLRKRVNFHGENLKKLQEQVGIENLPSDLGGKLGSVDEISEVWYNKVRSNEAYFQSHLDNKIEISKPITTKKNDEVVDALMGSYKKLSVD